MAALEALAPPRELQLQSSLAAVPFYEQLGWISHERVVENVGAATFRHVRMTKPVSSAQ